MRWPWRRHRDDEAEAARRSAEAAVRTEKARLLEVERIVESLAEHRERNNFAEQMRIAFGGRQ